MKLKEYINKTREVLDLNKKLGSPTRETYRLYRIRRGKPNFSGPKIEFDDGDQSISYKTTEPKTYRWLIDIRSGGTVQIDSCQLPKYGMTGIKDPKKLSDEILELEVKSTHHDGYYVTIWLGNQVTPIEVAKHAAMVARRTKKKASPKRSPRMTEKEYEHSIDTILKAEVGKLHKWIEDKMEVKFTSKVSTTDISWGYSNRSYGKGNKYVDPYAIESEYTALYTVKSMKGNMSYIWGRSPMLSFPDLEDRFTKATMMKKISDRALKDQLANVKSSIEDQYHTTKDADRAEWRKDMYEKDLIEWQEGLAVNDMKKITISKELEDEWGK